MTSRIVLPLLAAAAGVLGGCQQQSGGQGDKPAEVLDGTISDAMLPYDTVTSQPPLDPRAVRTARPGAAADEQATGEAVAPATPTPVASGAPPVAPAE